MIITISAPSFISIETNISIAQIKYPNTLKVDQKDDYFGREPPKCRLGALGWLESIGNHHRQCFGQFYGGMTRITRYGSDTRALEPR